MRWMWVVGTVACAGMGTAEPVETGATVWTRDADRRLPKPWREGPCMDVELADLDGDDDLDVVLAMEGPPNVVLENTGDAFVHREVGFRDGTDSEHAQVADLDGDGFVDLFFANEDLGGADELYLSTVPWAWRDASDELFDPVASNAALVVDLDGDGVFELVRGNAGQSTVWTVRDGALTASAWTLPEDDTVTQDVVAGDVDGDGDLDLVLGNEGADAVWLREGDGFVAGPPIPADGETREVALGDVDGDGVLDLVAARVGWREDDPQSRLYRGLGDGRFEVVDGGLPTETFNSLDLDFLDLDGDGDLDLLGAHTTNTGVGPWTAWRNDGGTFVDATATFLPRQPAGRGLDIESGDLDGDGRPDLYLCDRSGDDRVLYGRIETP